MFKSNNPLDRASDALIGHEIRKLNTHLPRQRRTLAELLEHIDSTVTAVDGSSILLKTGELEELAKTVPVEYRGRLKLPIIVLRRMELGKSVYTVAGDRIEEFTVKRILGLTDYNYQEMYMDHEMPFLYGPQVAELLRKFHTLVVIGFGIPRELSDYESRRT